jgi:hypothetical protein
MNHEGQTLGEGFRGHCGSAARACSGPVRTIHGFCRLLAAGLFALLAVSCAPVATIQSARVTSVFSVSPAAVYSPTRYTLYVGGAESMVYRPLNTVTDEMGRLGMLPRLSLGIARRVEVSAFLVPMLGEYIYNFGANVKINVIDIGEDRAFRNIAAALFAGGSGLQGEWDRFLFGRGGLIVGTHMPAGGGDLEFVFMPAYFQNTADTHPGEAPGIFLKERGLDLSLGALYWPGKKRIIQFNLGVTVRSTFTKELRVCSGEGWIDSHVSPFIGQGAVVFNIVRP